MFHRNHQYLNLPIHERRKHVRIITLKNFAWASLVAVLLFAVIDTASHFHAPRSGAFGRLYERHMAGEPVKASRAPEVVTEAPVPDQTGADPLLISAAARSQYLGTTTIAPTPTTSTTPCLRGDCSGTGIVLLTPETPARPHAGQLESGVVIVGDSSGVAIVQSSKEKTPKLSGGIFK